ncbi:hypothetical protein LINGRAHAP2_LOCUS20382, partial [Linum grandiflorum]
LRARGLGKDTLVSNKSIGSKTLTKRDSNQTLASETIRFYIIRILPP